MASLDDVLKNLDPALASKALEMLQRPSAIKSGIFNAIENFDLTEATNLVKEQIADYVPDIDFDIMTGGGFGGGSDTSGILSQAGDFALNQMGLPVSTSNVKNIYSGFTDPEAGEDQIKREALNILNTWGKKSAMNYVANVVAPGSPLAMQLISFIARTPMGQDITQQTGTMGSDIAGMFGIPWLFNRGKNMLGFNAAASDPVAESQITQDDTYLGGGATIEEAGGTAPGGGYATDYFPTYIPPTPEIISPHGGGQDTSSIPVSTPSLPNTPPPGYTPTPSPTPSLPNTPPPGYTSSPPGYTSSPPRSSFRPRHHALAQGGLVSMARVLRR